ncbi:hypothetical protein O2V63_05470 [Modestobacter sp. VKM Ac-2977]|nr:hypothetical protein [Modestobacter sp. VKM Ac-2977]MCZ2819773.1 hypothetical protein [Modestobacter sp. VKM Ac-2977]
MLTEECVRAVFGLDSKVIVDTTSGKPLMLPMGRHHTAPRADVLQGTPGS